MNKLQALFLETRAPFLTVTIIPVLLGTVMAIKTGSLFNWQIFLAIMFGFVFLHLGTNVLNDYFDDINGTDKINKEFIFPFTGGSRLIQMDFLKPKEVLIEAIVLFIIGSIFLLYVFYLKGFYILFLLIISLIAGIFYTAPPFKWAHRGLGEFFIFLGFGPIMVTGAYYAFAGDLNIKILFLSIPIGLLASSIIDINEFPDYNADKETGKKNILVRIGKKNGMIFYTITVILAYFVILLISILNIIPFWSIISILGFLFSLKAIIILNKNYNEPLKLAPACKFTIFSHFITGLLLIVIILISK